MRTCSLGHSNYSLSVGLESILYLKGDQIIRPIGYLIVLASVGAQDQFAVELLRNLPSFTHCQIEALRVAPLKSHHVTVADQLAYGALNSFAPTAPSTVHHDSQSRRSQK